jgi:hypothetical protein
MKSGRGALLAVIEYRRLRRRWFNLSPQQFEHQPSGAPLPMRPAQLEHQRLDPGRHLMWAAHRLVGPVGETFQPLHLVPRQPPVHRAPIHSPLGGHLRDGSALADDPQDRLIPLFSHAHLPHERDCDQSADLAGTHQPKVCDTSAEVLSRRVNRTSTLRNVGAAGFEPATLGL